MVEHLPWAKGHDKAICVLTICFHYKNFLSLVFLGYTVSLPRFTAESQRGNDNTARSDAMASRISAKHLGPGVSKEEMKCWLKASKQTDLAVPQPCYRFWQSTSPPSPTPLTKTKQFATRGIPLAVLFTCHGLRQQRYSLSYQRKTKTLLKCML